VPAVAEIRAGHRKGGIFTESLGGSLIQARATHPDIVEQIDDVDNVSTQRISTNVLGNGFVECVSDATLYAIRNAQPLGLRGLAVRVPVLEAAGQPRRVGRFGWKSQHGSLVSFSADAYLNERGITSPLFPVENTSNGMFVGFGTVYDPLQEPEDDGEDVQAFADFMRSTKAPSRGEISPKAVLGQGVFQKVGCAICHTPTMRTAAPGTPINGGMFIVPAALGNKVIHPYSDFLLHNVGTGDGIPIQTTPEFANTANKMRTAPLWGLRTRNRLMHDGLSLTKTNAIERHAGQAAGVRTRFNGLTVPEREELMAFLESL
jgi:CxxC motif-containing protein (DUF1111 family)